MNEALIKQVDNILPQTQCTRCGYPSCLSYAQAIVNNNTNINQCSPGGDEGIKKLAVLLDKEILPLNTLHGKIKAKEVAIIDEDACIGCTLCIKACPVDAIIGTNKMMHTIIETECTGCELCLPVCPVDCISLITDSTQVYTTELFRERYYAHKDRIKQQQHEREKRLSSISLKNTK